MDTPCTVFAALLFIYFKPTKQKHPPQYVLVQNKGFVSLEDDEVKSGGPPASCFLGSHPSRAVTFHFMFGVPSGPFSKRT